MNKYQTMKLRIRLTILATLALFLSLSGAVAKPLKIYILAGQSNMQGKPSIHVLQNGLKDSRETQYLHDLLIGSNGEPRVFDQVHVAAVSDGPTEKNGPLTVGFGNDLTGKRGLKWGPELAFGATMFEIQREPILIIKTSWGGKSLNTDFLPPSGAALMNGKSTGPYYKMMMEQIEKVLREPGRYHPSYRPEQGYELAGFVWFQGWNDMADKSLYPENKPGRYDLYSDLLAHLIRDVRSELKAPKMPFVIGVMGVGNDEFRAAMAAPAALPEFAGNVLTVNTRDYMDPKLEELVDRGWRWQRPKWDPENKYADLREKLQPLDRELKAAGEIKDRDARVRAQRELKERMERTMYTEEESEYLKNNKSSQGFHYNGSPKFFARVGEAFARALL